MTLIEDIRKLRGDVNTMIGICEGASSEAAEEGFKLEVLRRLKNLSEHAENMVEETDVLETHLQTSEMAQAEMRRELDKLQETFNIRLQDHVKAETKEIQLRLAEHMEKQFDSRFIALATEVRQADAEASPCQMEREKRLDEKEKRLCEMEKRLLDRQEELNFREASLRETRSEVNSRMRELAADRSHSFEHLQEILDDRFSTMQTRLEDLSVIRRLQDDVREQHAALRDLPSKDDVASVLSRLFATLSNKVDTLANWRGATTPDRLQATLEEVSRIGTSIQRQVNITSEVLDQISSDLSKLGGPTPPSTTEAGKPRWLYKYQSLRFWDSTIDGLLNNLGLLNVVGVENMEPKELRQLLLDTLEPTSLQHAILLVVDGPAEVWFCFPGIRHGEELEAENGQCPYHRDCILVKRVEFHDETGRHKIGLKFRKVHPVV
ncbi:hypothetical protein MHUMG1_07970 [Metarhizium humberi]|uniref:Uncharacterized protein n=1 Tax=Metarhizium humberi TaxID=2596975 RepID=A0A9P8M449_9HYPO|nr:hypothetical protein MHUMG1_07970 [Metarhizium humberi]